MPHIDPAVPMHRAADLRRRATHLRHLAESIEATPATSLEVHAGDDTWRGERPTLCRSLLVTNVAQLHAEAERLRWTAFLFERRAGELDAIGLAG